MKLALKTATFSLLLLVLCMQPAHAFITWSGQSSSLEIRGLLRGSALLLKNPDAPLFYNKRTASGLAGSGRLMVDAGVNEAVSLEMHVVQNYIPLSLQQGGSNLVALQGVERSDLLDWSYDNRAAHLLIDRLNLQYRSNSVNIKAGRQPVNLATTFYFTPNDFFAPFAAQIFFRSYKPGVDALRADVQLAGLSQLSLISVLGYRSDATGDNGWSSRVDAARNSYLARLSGLFGDFELALLAGSIKKDRVVGGDLQGELLEWLGVRAEGHVNFPDQAGLKRRVEFALGLEHRWENSLNLRVEQFYHGGGAASSATYAAALAAQTSYLARNYSALGVSYEFTPLLSGDLTVIHNWMDQSDLAAVYLLYSLSDESELAFSAAMARGARSVGLRINSEFGLYPDSLSAEIRCYF